VEMKTGMAMMTKLEAVMRGDLTAFTNSFVSCTFVLLA